MGSRLKTDGRKILIPLGCGIIIVLAIALGQRLFGPQLKAYYLLARGSELINRAWSDKSGLPCENKSVSRIEIETEITPAIDYLEQAIRLNSGLEQSYLLLARAYCLAGEPGEAISYYTQFSDHKPEDIISRLEIGFAYEARCPIALVIDGDLSLPASYCANPVDVALIKDNWNRAGLTPSDFIERGQQAILSHNSLDAYLNARRAILLGPDLGDGYFLIGQILSEESNYEEADTWFQKALSLAPTRLDWYLERGNAAILWKNYPLAAEVYNQALKFLPDSPEVYYELASVYQQLGQFEEARLAIDSAIQLKQPSDPRYFIRAGQIKFGLGENEAAKENYLQAIQTASNPHIAADAYIELGELLYNGDGDEDSAIAAFEKSIAIDPSRGAGYFEIGQVRASEGAYSSADTWFAQAIQREPQMDWWQLRRADNARNAGELQQAISLYQETITHFPAYALAYHQLAWAYRLNGETGPAIEAIEKAGDLFTNKEDWYFVRAGEIYRWAGLQEKAIQAYQQALALNPANQTAIEGLGILNQ